MTAQPIRPAKPTEAALLTDLAIAAKGHWAYSEAQLAAWSGDIAISAESIRRQPTFVAENAGVVAGFYQLKMSDGLPELDHLWVSAEYMGCGFGKALLRHARQWLSVHGHREVAIDADPNAEAFYLSQGARRVGEIAAPIAGQPERVRPQLILPTA